MPGSSRGFALHHRWLVIAHWELIAHLTERRSVDATQALRLEATQAITSARDQTGRRLVSPKLSSAKWSTVCRTAAVGRDP